MGVSRGQGFRTKATRLRDLTSEGGVRGAWDGVRRYVWYGYVDPARRRYHTAKRRCSIAVGGAEATFSTETEGATKEILFARDHELSLLTELVSELRPGDVFYDVGANVGVHTCLAASAIEDGTVYAFEPNPVNREQLHTNGSINDVSPTVVDYALSDREETVSFAHDPEAVSGKSALGTREDSHHVDVETVRGDTLVARGSASPPTVVKIDVEGAEYAVIEGLADSLRHDRCRTVYCEVHLPEGNLPSIADYGVTYDDVRRRLRALGFSLTVVEERGRTVQLRGEK